MNILEAENLAKKLMRQHLGTDYDFKWGTAKTIFGSCHYPSTKRRGYIRLSKPLTDMNSVEHVTDTILHEIAHALVGADQGHNHRWQRKAEQIGAQPNATSSWGKAADPKYVMYSPKTGNKVQTWQRSPTKKTVDKLHTFYERGYKNLTLGTMQILTWDEYKSL